MASNVHLLVVTESLGLQDNVVVFFTVYSPLCCFICDVRVPGAHTRREHDTDVFRQCEFHFLRILLALMSIEKKDRSSQLA